ncbi:DUF4145 domain-containing protein [Enterococcus thailandicus]
MEETFATSNINWSGSVTAVGGHTSKGILCPHCQSISAQTWYYGLGADAKRIGAVQALTGNIVYNPKYIIIRATCNSCGRDSIWKKDKDTEEESLMFPRISVGIELPNQDMPDEISKIYTEASLVLNDSPRASAALSRLAIDKLTVELEPEGKNLNSRIGKLVEKGLPITIQQSLDIVRVVGNNAVHPGEIDISDNREIAHSLLELLNFIVYNQISQPKRIKEMFQNLPQGARDAIDKRDNH